MTGASCGLRSSGAITGLSSKTHRERNLCVKSSAYACSFEATIGDRKVVTETKRKAEAEAEYAAATQQGHTAVLAKQASLEPLSGTAFRALLCQSKGLKFGCRISAVNQNGCWGRPYVLQACLTKIINHRLIESRRLHCRLAAASIVWSWGIWRRTPSASSGCPTCARYRITSLCPTSHMNDELSIWT